MNLDLWPREKAIKATMLQTIKPHKATRHHSRLKKYHTRPNKPIKGPANNKNNNKASFRTFEQSLRSKTEWCWDSNTICFIYIPYPPVICFQNSPDSQFFKKGQNHTFTQSLFHEKIILTPLSIALDRQEISAAPRRCSCCYIAFRIA